MIFAAFLSESLRGESPFLMGEFTILETFFSDRRRGEREEFTPGVKCLESDLTGVTLEKMFLMPLKNLRTGDRLF
jgi:hypothetical protein